jgi:hypothetical protein
MRCIHPPLEMRSRTERIRNPCCLIRGSDTTSRTLCR